jgi:hypothetical protein
MSPSSRAFSRRRSLAGRSWPTGSRRTPQRRSRRAQKVILPGPYNAMVAESLHNRMAPWVLAERRKIELQGGKSAVLVMSRAGFDPAALLRYVERVQPPDAKAGVSSHFEDQWFSTFPARADRIAALQKALRGLPAALVGRRVRSFARFKSRCVPASEVPKSVGPTLSKPERGALIPR